MTRLLGKLLGERTQVSVQCPVVIPQWSEPNPDVALLVPRSDFYADAHPLPRQVQALIEVADTSLAYDTKVKAPLYAKAGIRELWVIDLKGKRVLVHTRPKGDAYNRVRAYQAGERFTSQRFSGVEFTVKDLLV